MSAGTIQSAAPADSPVSGSKRPLSEPATERAPERAHEPAPELTSEPAHEPAAEIARRVAHELHQLSSVTSRIECAVSGLMLNSSGTTPGLHRDLQSLDSLGQMLDALAQFLTDMAAQIPPDWTFDPTNAAASVKLKDLANRLANQNQENQNPDNDCEFF